MHIDIITRIAKTIKCAIFATSNEYKAVPNTSISIMAKVFADIEILKYRLVSINLYIPRTKYEIKLEIITPCTPSSGVIARFDATLMIATNIMAGIALFVSLHTDNPNQRMTMTLRQARTQSPL